MTSEPLAPFMVLDICRVATSTTEIVASPAFTTFNLLPPGENTAVMAFLPVDVESAHRLTLAEELGSVKSDGLQGAERGQPGLLE